VALEKLNATECNNRRGLASEGRRDTCMNAPKKAPSPRSENLLPASLADRQLDHLERMIRSVAQNNPAGPVHGMDPEYWKSRIRALVEENNLVAVQQHRVKRLLKDLENRTKSRTLNRTAA
jgi:hypothetical protein